MDYQKIVYDVCNLIDSWKCSPPGHGVMAGNLLEAVRGLMMMIRPSDVVEINEQLRAELAEAQSVARELAQSIVSGKQFSSVAVNKALAYQAGEAAKERK